MGSDPPQREVARRIGLDSEVKRSNSKPLRPLRLHDVTLICADVATKISTEHGGLVADPTHKLGLVGQRGTGEYARPHGTAGPKMTNHRSGVHAGDSDDVLLDQFVTE